MCRSCFVVLLVYYSFGWKCAVTFVDPISIDALHSSHAVCRERIEIENRRKREKKWRAATDSPTGLAQWIERILMDEHWALCKLWPFTHMQVNKVQLVRKKANKIFSHSVQPWHNWTCVCLSGCVRMWIAFDGEQQKFYSFVLEFKLNVDGILESGNSKPYYPNQLLTVAIMKISALHCPIDSCRWFLPRSLTHTRSLQRLNA